MTTSFDPKKAARRLRESVAGRGLDIGHSEALELVAVAHGFRDWNTMAATKEPQALAAIPVVRIFDQAKAYEFYCEFLGFEVAWEHRFEPDLPLYCEIVRDGIRLHLSEHHGDGSPGIGILIEVADVRALHRTLNDKHYGFARPGLQQQDWGLDLTVHDPFGNKVTFLEHSPADQVSGA